MGKYESPNYEVVLQDDQFEIRDYNSFPIVEYEDENDPNVENSFKSLFSYISGDNHNREKIKMTIPVIREESKKINKMAFVVPKKFEKQIPEPNNSNLKVKIFEGGLFGTIKYSGYSNKSKESEMKSKLQDWISDQNYKIISNCIIASYNAPFIPLFRKNEIWVRISKNRVN